MDVALVEPVVAWIENVMPDDPAIETEFDIWLNAVFEPTDTYSTY